MVSVARREKSAHQEDSFDQEPMTAITRRFVSCALVILFWAPISASSQDISEPEGYRITTLKGARVVTTAEAEQIWKAGGAIFLDVLPYAPRPTNLPPGTIWREKPRRNIPGSSWLPDTGYGALAPVTENYLRTNLARVIGGDRTKALRVMECGKTNPCHGICKVVWYPDGTDGWAEADLPLCESMPEP